MKLRRVRINIANRGLCDVTFIGELLDCGGCDGFTDIGHQDQRPVGLYLVLVCNECRCALVELQRDGIKDSVPKIGSKRD